MLIYFSASIKTTLLLLLFTVGGLNLYAGISSARLPQNDTMATAKAAVPQYLVVIPENERKQTINFQVNSTISYFSFSHFAKDESKKTFYTAWQKEKEARKLSSKTDSLRKLYANSSDDQKEKISTLILKAEQRQMALNEEIPALYAKVRNDENQYWQSASADEKAKFQEKIKLFRDSIQQATAALNKQTLPDTITFYHAKPRPVANVEPASAIIYKIQVGAFKGKLPDTAAKSIKKLSMLRKVENYKDEKGITVYTTGSLKNYQDAVTMQSQVKLEGIKNATIAVYNNGKRITLEEARKLNNEPVKP
jgi:hypothetical protein